MRYLSLTLAAVFLAGCSHISNTDSHTEESAATIPGYQVFYDQESNLTVEYPANWVQQSDTYGFNNQAYAFVSPYEDADDIFNDNVSILIQDLKQAPIKLPITLAAYVELSKGQLKTAQAQVLHEAEDVTLFGLPAYEISYKTVMQDREMQFWQRWAVSEDTAYVYTYTALPDSYDKYLEIAKQMVEVARFEEGLD